MCGQGALRPVGRVSGGRLDAPICRGRASGRALGRRQMCPGTPRQTHRVGSRRHLLFLPKRQRPNHGKVVRALAGPPPIVCPHEDGPSPCGRTVTTHHPHQTPGSQVLDAPQGRAPLHGTGRGFHERDSRRRQREKFGPAPGIPDERAQPQKRSLGNPPKSVCVCGISVRCPGVVFQAFSRVSFRRVCVSPETDRASPLRKGTFATQAPVPLPDADAGPCRSSHAVYSRGPVVGAPNAQSAVYEQSGL
mmetsp:Transcript_26257/g.66818  ORF Transcript_26257/g.66818 Transcript_26257/m.66818 type:complete len:248 (-) Transcript_26257:301-1044(-)